MLLVGRQEVHLVPVHPGSPGVRAVRRCVLCFKALVTPILCIVSVLCWNSVRYECDGMDVQKMKIYMPSMIAVQSLKICRRKKSYSIYTPGSVLVSS